MRASRHQEQKQEATFFDKCLKTLGTIAVASATTSFVIHLLPELTEKTTALSDYVATHAQQVNGNLAAAGNKLEACFNYLTDKGSENIKNGGFISTVTGISQLGISLAACVALCFPTIAICFSTTAAVTVTAPFAFASYFGWSIGEVAGNLASPVAGPVVSSMASSMASFMASSISKIWDFFRR